MTVNQLLLQSLRGLHFIEAPWYALRQVFPARLQSLRGLHFIEASAPTHG